MKLTKSKLKQLVKEALEIHIAPAGLTDMDAKTAYDDREEDAMWGGYVELHKQLYNSSPDTEDMTYDEMMLAYKKLEDYSALKEHAKARAKGTNHMKLTKTKLKQIIKEVLEAEEVIEPTDDIYLDRETSDQLKLPYQNTGEITRFGPDQIKQLMGMSQYDQKHQNIFSKYLKTGANATGLRYGWWSLTK